MMRQHVIQTIETPELIVRGVAGNLTIRDWDRSEISIRADEDELTLESDPERVEIESSGDCMVHVPVNATIRVGHADGDTQIAGIQGRITIGHVSGDLNLRDVGPTAIENVAGNLASKQLSGELSVQNVGGDLAVEEVQGAFTASNVGGDLTLSEIDGNVQGRAGGDATMQLALQPDCAYRVNAGGDITCRIQSDASATVHLTSGGKVLVKRLPAPQTKTKGNYEFVLGAGEASLNLTAGGSIVLTGHGAHEYGNFDVDVDVEIGREFAERAGEVAQQVSDQIEAHMELLARQLDEKLAQLGTGDEIAARVQQKVQSAMHRAEEKIARAMEQAERQRTARGRTGRTCRNPTTPPCYPLVSRQPYTAGAT